MKRRSVWIFLSLWAAVTVEAKWLTDSDPYYPQVPAVRVDFKVLRQDICLDSHSDVCVEFTWSCYEPSELTQRYSRFDRTAKPPRRYILDVEGAQETLRFEMKKATTMNPTGRLRPFNGYVAKVYIVHDHEIALLKNFTFRTITGAPSPVQQLTVDVLRFNATGMPRARKLNVSWHAPENLGAMVEAGYVVGLYKKPEINAWSTNNRNTTIVEVETNHTWRIIEPVTFYEKKLFVKVIPYNRLRNGSLVYGGEVVADVYVRSQYAGELAINSVGGQNVDIEMDQDIFKDVIEAGLVESISVFVSPVDMHDHLSWKATDFTKAVIEDRMKNKQIRAVYRVSPHGWNLRNALDKQRPDYNQFPCYQAGDRRKVVCSIGVDDKCARLLYSQICNAPLIENMNYTVFVRAQLKRSNFLPQFDDSKPLAVKLHSVFNQFGVGRNTHSVRHYNGWKQDKSNRHDSHNRHADAPGVYRIDRFDLNTDPNRFDPRFDTNAGNVDPNRFDPRFDPNPGNIDPNRFDPRFDPNTGNINPNRFDPNSGRFRNGRQDTTRMDKHGTVPIGPANQYIPMNIPEQP